MHANVPQFIDIEDKIAFGLTGKQLLWMGGMGATLLVSYSLFDRATFYVTGVFIILIFAAFAFWKPHGVTLLTFLGFAIQFYIRPRSYVWKRRHSGSPAVLSKKSGLAEKDLPMMAQKKKRPTESQLKRIAWVLDTKK